MIIWFGVGEEPKIALVAFASACPVYINTYAGIRGVDNRLVESGRVVGLGQVGLIRHVILPGSVPGFLVGLRFALTSAWLVIIIAEQLNATSGIGYLMNQAQAWYRTDIIVLGLVDLRRCSGCSPTPSVRAGASPAGLAPRIYRA